MKKKIVIIIIAVVALVAVYRIYNFITTKANKNNGAVPEEREIPVKAVAVKQIDMVESMNYTGDIVGTEVVNVFSQVPGKIKQINATEGQHVNKGQTLFKIDRDIVGMDYMPAIVDSPITGYIGKVMVDKGVTVSPASPLAQVVNMNDVEAVIFIIERNINKIKLGMTAEVKVATFRDRVFYGKVYKKSAVVDPVNRTLEVHILLDNKNLLLKHGMFADVKIIIDKKNNTLAVPVDSIMMDENNNFYVMLAKDGKAVKRNVKTGIDFESYTEILSGLTVNDVVVTLGKENVTNGSRLLVYREDVDKNSKEKKTAGD
ncbi:MAG: efflux RND transporter periplasmic adaptor subunit [Spirochaetes bacterium]|nr:efflux RND transporter periplasmic adaptor subunit [Spirochaetota bacterium]